MTEQRKFPKESYPCPCCHSKLAEMVSDIYKCENKHKFRLEVHTAIKKRVLTVIQGCEAHQKGDMCIVDAIWFDELPTIQRTIRND